MGNEVTNIHAAIRHQLEKSLHVTILRPANVADGVVPALFFVVWIVAARAIGA